MKRSLQIAFFIIGVLLPLLFYELWGKELVIAIFEGKGTVFSGFVNAIYPRFAVEKNRLPLDFFMHKSFQIILRCSLLFLLAGLFFYSQKKYSRFSTLTANFSSVKTSVHAVIGLRIVFFLLLLVAGKDIYDDLRALLPMEDFFRPISFLKVLHIPFPSKRESFILYGIFFFACFMGIFGIRPVAFSTLAAVCFILYQAYLNSFEKMDHGFAPLIYAALLFPFVLFEKYKAKKKNTPIFYSWSLRLIQIVIALVYFQAGIEKLLISGFHWVSAETFRSYIYLHNAPVGLWVASSDFLSFLLPLCGLVFQLSFPLLLFYPKLLKLPILLTGVLFHLGTVLLFGISHFFNPWLFTYIFFIDLSLIGKPISSLSTYFKT